MSETPSTAVSARCTKCGCADFESYTALLDHDCGDPSTSLADDDPDDSRPPLVADGGTQTARLTAAFDGDLVQLQLHPHYTARCGSPSFHVADRQIRIEIDIAPLDADRPTGDDWVTLAYPVADIVALLDDGTLVEDRERLNARYRITATVEVGR